MHLKLVFETIINSMLSYLKQFELFLRYAISTFKYCMHTIYKIPFLPFIPFIASIKFIFS